MQYAASPIMIHNALSFPVSNHQEIYLEQFLHSQEAAKCFDDDLDFCPILTATELGDILKESASAQKSHLNRWQQKQDGTLRPSPGSGPLSSRTAATNRRASKAIRIVDPNSKTPVQLPDSMRNSGEGSSSTTSPLSSVVTLSRHGSFSSESSVGSSDSMSDMSSSIDASMEMHDATMLDWSLQHQQYYQQHLQNMQQFQQWQPPHLSNDGPDTNPSLSRPLMSQQEMVDPLGMYSPLMMAF